MIVSICVNDYPAFRDIRCHVTVYPFRCAVPYLKKTI